MFLNSSIVSVVKEGYLANSYRINIVSNIFYLPINFLVDPVVFFYLFLLYIPFYFISMNTLIALRTISNYGPILNRISQLQRVLWMNAWPAQSWVYLLVPNIPELIMCEHTPLSPCSNIIKCRLESHSVALAHLQTASSQWREEPGEPGEHRPEGEGTETCSNICESATTSAHHTPQ